MIPENSLKFDKYLSPIHKTKRNKIHSLYLDYVNNLLTVGGFASYYGLDEEVGFRIIATGRKINRKTFG